MTIPGLWTVRVASVNGGEQYHVNLKLTVASLLEATIDCVMLEELSTKAVRVFHYFREKRYVQIQAE